MLFIMSNICEYYFIQYHFIISIFKIFLFYLNAIATFTLNCSSKIEITHKNKSSMKRLIISFTLLVCLLVTAGSCINIVGQGVTPSKNYVSKKVNVGDFKGISTSCSIDVIYTQTSGDRNVEIFTSDNILPYIVVEVKGDVLNVRMKDNTRITSVGPHKMEVRVSAPAVDMLSASSSGDVILKNGLNNNGNVSLRASSSGDIKGGDVHCKTLDASSSSSGDILLGNVKCENLNVECNSSGDFKLNMLECKDVRSNSSSSGDVTLSGVCNIAYYNASSSGDINASDLKAKVVEARASSAGDIKCYASQSIKGSRSSAGNISFSGNPAQIDIRK